MAAVLRFAPSPTGYMHIGNARTALVNWLFAQQLGGTFYLRFDDTDLARSRVEYADAIKNDLNWLGWLVDDQFSQSSRLDRYKAIVQHLIASQHLYPCYETPEELEFKRKRQRASGKPPIYDRAALKITESEKQKLVGEGRTPHWRFMLKSEKVMWDDMAHGEITLEPTHLSDPILIREDGTPVYTLSSVVDDLDYGITHIVRGNDHITNTAVQLQLWQAINPSMTPINFAHLPLITGEHGEGLSKRLGSLGIGQLREEGIEPLAISSYLAKLGTSHEIAPELSLQSLVDQFSIEKFAHSSPKFARSELDRLNTKIIHSMPFEHVQKRLAELKLPVITEQFWHIVHSNLETWQDIKGIWAICYDQIIPIIDDQNYINQALNLLPAVPWDDTTWSTWTNHLKVETNRKGKELFMPLRKAITAQEHGPEMKYLLPIIGYEKVRQRLMGKTA